MIRHHSSTQRDAKNIDYIKLEETDVISAIDEVSLDSGINRVDFQWSLKRNAKGL